MNTIDVKNIAERILNDDYDGMGTYLKLKILAKAYLEKECPEIIFKIGPNYLYAETYRDMFAQVKKRYSLPYAYDTFLKTVKDIVPTAQDDYFIEYDFCVPEQSILPSQLDTILQLPKSALLR